VAAAATGAGLRRLPKLLDRANAEVDDGGHHGLFRDAEAEAHHAIGATPDRGAGPAVTGTGRVLGRQFHVQRQLLLRLRLNE
jgi:hypothetical protein